MKVLIIFILITSSFAQKSQTFEEWQKEHSKKFNFFERFTYRKNFFANVAAIEAHNSKPEETYKKGLNEFSYINPDDFIATSCKTMVPTDMEYSDLSSEFEIDYKRSETPESLDYSSLMRGVQSQGNCGACWAFSTMGQIEGLLRSRNSTNKVSLSAQYLIDCDDKDNGCTSGWPTYAMNWLKTKGNNSAPLADSYPFIEMKQSCKLQNPTIQLNITSVRQENLNGDEKALKKLLIDNGPIVVAMYAPSSFMSYDRGVFYDSACSKLANSCTKINHAVIVVGYGSDPIFGDYWKVKNSWGTSWGDFGYGLIARNRKNNCNIACWAMWTS